MSINQKIYKTTINCGGCIRAVTPFLNETVGEGNWEVNTEVPDKILKVTSPNVDSEQIVAAVEKAGFKIEEI